MSAEHEHAAEVAMYGECLTCIVRAGSGRDDITVQLDTTPLLPSPLPDHDGATYRHEFDYERLGAQARRVWDAISDGRWHTLAELSQATGDPEASVSARLRDFRKAGWGSHRVEHERLGAGLWRYRLLRT